VGTVPLDEETLTDEGCAPRWERQPELCLPASGRQWCRVRDPSHARLRSDRSDHSAALTDAYAVAQYAVRPAGYLWGLQSSCLPSPLSSHQIRSYPRHELLKTATKQTPFI
jgi:hypothetical protein